ncbi:MAG TPA: LacI family DNA-binding transcriptional regulator [Ktedonobacterales bacterium]|nr:LacI family DNA-binding transcriptional regulator [Ktedonobacterales bacterium]
MRRRAVTIKDVARRVGVSISTVSRVLNDTSYVSTETRQVVLQAIRELHFEPSQIARGFSNKKTATVGLIIPDVANPFFSDVARGTEEMAIEDGLATILCNSDWKSEREVMYLNLLRGRWVDGVIVVGSRSSPETIEQAAGDVPYVLVERLNVRTGYTVWIDNRRGSALATQHLLDVGCRHIVHISGPAGSPSAAERRLGFLDAMRHAGFDSYEIIEGDYRFQSGLDIGRQIFTSAAIPDGVFAANDLMAIGVLRAAALVGVRVPEQVAVIGYDNIPPAEFAAPALSTVDQPAYEMGKAAMKLLLARMRDHPSSDIGRPVPAGSSATEHQIEFQPRLIVRASTQRSKT